MYLKNSYDIVTYDSDFKSALGIYNRIFYIGDGDDFLSPFFGPCCKISEFKLHLSPIKWLTLRLITNVSNPYTSIHSKPWFIYVLGSFPVHITATLEQKSERNVSSTYLKRIFNKHNGMIYFSDLNNYSKNLTILQTVLVL